MKKRLLVNVYFSLDMDDNSDHFSVLEYKIFPPSFSSIRSENYRKHNQNAYIEFEGNQRDSILYSGGVRGDERNLRNRKLLEDILVVGSLLNGWNWGLFSWRNYSNFPAVAKPHIETLELSNKESIEEYFRKAFVKINDPSWQTEFDNGFHLRVLLNNANILNSESRFLSNVVIWEWLYSHLQSQVAENDRFKLDEVFNFILNKYWPSRKFKGNIVFQALRNQLAHSGRLPIDRRGKYVDDWMKELNFEDSDGVGINDYMKFFDMLTQVIVLKTLDIDAEHIIRWNLDQFLEHGR